MKAIVLKTLTIRNRKFLLIFLLLLVFPVFIFSRIVSAQTNDEKLQQLAKQIQEYEDQITKLQSQANTLSNQIAQYDAQIRLTTLKITQTEEKIFLLSGRIDQLEVSLAELTKAFINRINKSYKMARINQTYLILALAPDINDAIISYHYLSRIQESDENLLERLVKAQDAYKVEKTNQQDLQKELEDQKAALNSQKLAKANLLAVTKNNEKKYQQLLAQSRSEYEAIQAIISGKGEEVEVGKVSAGQRIATIIQGASCNSSGTHLHFTVRKPQGITDNPFNYLKSGISFENDSGGDSFNPSGSWEWPINQKIMFNQGYGANTSAIRSHIVWYSFHTGIDINSSSSSEVHAVKSGTLYRGSYSGNGSCRLRYVRVDHDDSDLDSLYLHVNY